MASRDRRIVLLGKTGTGKSSTGNTIFGGEEVFPALSSPESITKYCKSECRTIEGRSVTLIDTPGFFDTRISEDELNPEIIHFMTECSAGIHAFLIVLKVERFTIHEKEICTKIQQSFSDEAFKYATVLFTHGDDLESKTIQDFIKGNNELSKLVQKCGGRCHVIDNKHWNQGRWFRNTINQVQVSELLKSIDHMVEQNRGKCYTNEMLQAVEEDIQVQKKKIRETSHGELSDGEIHSLAKKIVQTNLCVKWAGVATVVLVGAVLGAVIVAGLALCLTGRAAIAVVPVARAVKSAAEKIRTAAAAVEEAVVAEAVGRNALGGRGLGIAEAVMLGAGAVTGAAAMDDWV